MSGRCLLKICKDKRHELSSFIGRKQTVKRITWPTIHDIPFFYTITNTFNPLLKIYEFHDGVSNYTDIIHFQTELNKVCEELNQKNAEVPVPLFEVIDIAHHPTVLFHFGAYTFIGYNVFELYSEDNRTYGAVASFGHSSRNYNHLPYRAKAQQILYDYLLEIRKAGKLRP